MLEEQGIDDLTRFWSRKWPTGSKPCSWWWWWWKFWKRHLHM